MKFLKKDLFAATFYGLIFLTCSNAKVAVDNEDPPKKYTVKSHLNYRSQMRSFVMRIAQEARKVDEGFLVIPQNGVELVTLNGKPNGRPAEKYLRLISGNGQESLFYGEPNDDRRTPEERTRYLIDYLNVSKKYGNSILVTDYCFSLTKVRDAITKNRKRGYSSFPADQRGLTNIPELPGKSSGFNRKNISTLNDANNHIFILNYAEFNSKEHLLRSLANTNYDVIIMDAFYNDGKPFSRSDIDRLKKKSNGASRLVICYMSIGEAEDYRFYWNPKWKFNPPNWLLPENKNWPGNYKVEYWNKEWQNLIIYDRDSYLKMILKNGFEGVYLDIVDAFDYFENLN